MSDRFYDTPDWRFIVTDLSLEVTTCLNPIATGRSVTKTLGAALVIEGQVDSDDPKVNGGHSDGYAKLSEGDRFIFGFRRDGSSPSDVWTCRAAGRVLNLQTTLDGDWPLTRYVAYDPRQDMFKRPCRDAAGVLPGAAGIVYANASARDILVEQIERSETYDGNTFIDLSGPNLNQTAAIADYTIQQGMTIGELMDDLERGGTIDILLDPLWQAFGSGGPKIVELATYDQAGVSLPNVYFAWDMPGRNVDQLSIDRDGTTRENAVRTHYGQGGDAVTTFEDVTSQARYGTYWGELFLPGLPDAAAAELVAAKRLQLQAQGIRTVTVSVAPERGAAPLAGYTVGDRVVVLTSAAALEQISEEYRVRSIPIAIDDFGVETVSGLVFDEDGWSASS